MCEIPNRVDWIEDNKAILISKKATRKELSEVAEVVKSFLNSPDKNNILVLPSGWEFSDQRKPPSCDCNQPVDLGRVI